MGSPAQHLNLGPRQRAAAYRLLVPAISAPQSSSASAPSWTACCSRHCHAGSSACGHHGCRDALASHLLMQVLGRTRHHVHMHLYLPQMEMVTYGVSLACALLARTWLDENEQTYPVLHGVAHTRTRAP